VTLATALATLHSSHNHSPWPIGEAGAVELEDEQVALTSEAAMLYGQGGEQAKHYLKRSVMGSGLTVVWLPLKVPRIHTPLSCARKGEGNR